MLISMLGGKEAGAVQSRGSTYQAASLPVMCFDWNGEQINPLYGQKELVERGALRPSVYPFISDELSMTVHLLEGKVRPRELTYELRDEKDHRLVAQGTVSQFTEEESRLSFPLSFQDILTEDQYYFLDLSLSLGNQTVYYRTRVIKLSDKSTLSMLSEYGRHMHEDLMNQDAARAYASHLETDTYSDKESLSFVSLNSSFEQLSWGSAEVSQMGNAWMTIEGIQENYLYLHFSYLAQAPMNNELNAMLRVSESISLQRYGMAIYLLNYERHTGQLWSFESNSVVNDGILLGIQEPARLSAVSSPGEAYYAFSVNGDLYLYDVNNTNLTKLFSFRQPGDGPLHTLCQDYDIKIMEVSDEGQVEFAVFGYMNGGPQEGSCGISYCRYIPEDNELRELTFLHSRQAPASLEREVHRLFAKGQDNFLYFILDEELLVMDIDTGETAVLVSREEYPSLVVSDSGKIFAWSSETDQTHPKSLRIIKLEDGRRETLNADEDAFIRPLGFLREDLVLGYGSLKKAALWDGGSVRHPLQRIEILGTDLNVLYTYQKEDTWIDQVKVLDDKLELHRYSYTEDQYSYLPADVMLRSHSPDRETAYFSSYQHESLKKLAVLRISRLPSSLRIEQSTPRSVVEGKQLELPSVLRQQTYDKRFYAYGKESLMGAFNHLGSAIHKAQEANGFVLARDGRLAWNWVGRQESVILDIGEEILSPGNHGEDVSGASLRDLICFLHDKKPVRWVSPDQGELWLIGYEWKNVVLYNPQNANVFRMLQTDFDELISRDNNYLWILDKEP